MRNEELFQVSTLTAFQNKGYDGQVSVRRMLQLKIQGIEVSFEEKEILTIIEA